MSSSTERILNAMAARLVEAKRLLIIVRPSANRGLAAKSLRAVSDYLGIEPIVTESPRGMADLKYSEIVRKYKETDCALVVAPADFTVGYLARSVIAPRGRLLHIDAPGDPRPRSVPDLHAQISPTIALSHVAQVVKANGLSRTADGSANFRIPKPDACSFPPSSAGLHPLEVANCVREVLGPRDILVLDGGEFCQWIRLGLRDLSNRMLWNAKFGAIGGSIPMALGIAAMRHSGHTIAFLGDGSAGYHVSEFETAVRYGIPFVAIVGNDARWAAEWHLQAKRYGFERTFETNLLPVRYDLVASGLGAAGFNVADTGALCGALSVSLGEDHPACINLRILSVRSPATCHQ